MKLKNMLRTFILSNVAIAVAMICYSPVMANSSSVASHTNARSSLNILVAQELDVLALEEAADHMTDAADALAAAGASQDSSEEQAFFQAAIAAMDAAADSLEVAGIPDAASAMDDFINAVEAANAAETEEEEQEYIDAAEAAMEDLQAALESVGA